MSTNINPVLSGLIQAHQFAQALKAQTMQQDALTLQKQREARDAAVQDIQTKMNLAAAGAKPLDASGNYQQQVQMPNASVGGITIPGATVNSNIPASPNQVASYGGHKYQIPTRDQLENDDFNSKLNQAKTSAQVMGPINNANAIALKQGELNIPVTLPGLGDVTSGALPFVTRRAENNFTAGQNDLNRQSREKIAGNTQ